jgi:hydrogenase maturation factor
MHDATECGIWGACFEIAQAAGLGIRIEKEKIVVEDGVEEMCRFLDIDPFSSISEGTLILTCKEHNAPAVVDALKSKGIKSSIVGELTRPEQGMILIEKGREGKLVHPLVDPFWKAFYGAMEKYKQ